MKLAILFYAVFTIVGSADEKEMISWGLTFDNHQKCIEFYNNNSAKLLRIANGFVVMDVFGLTLSRAIGLVVS